MEFSLPIFTWVQSLKFEEILFGAQQRGCHGTLCLHAVPVVSRGSTGEVVART